MQRAIIIIVALALVTFGGIASYFLNIDKVARARVDCLQDAKETLNAGKDALCAEDGLSSGCSEYWHEPNEVTEPLLQQWSEANRLCDLGV